jgi:hypothetical protein
MLCRYAKKKKRKKERNNSTKTFSGRYLTKEWKDIPCLWISRTNIGKMAVLLRTICVFTAIPIKIPRHSSQRLKNQL